MTASTAPPDPNTVEDSYGAALDAQLAASARARRWGAALGSLALVALGVIPWLLGAGWFGLRLASAGEVPIHVLNTSGSDIEVQVSFASRRVVASGTMETIETLAGPVSLTTHNADGELLESFEFEASVPVFYNAMGSECLAVFDLTPYYGGQTEQPLQVLRRITRDERLVELDAGTLLLPRRTAPDQATPPVHWVEVVGCTLLEPAEEDYLVGQAEFRLQQRRDAYNEAREAAR